MLARVLCRGMGHTMDLEELRVSILEGRRILWAIHAKDRISSCVVFEAVRHPSGRVVLRVLALAGARFWEWAEGGQRLLEDLAELTGAHGLEAVARPGLARWLRRLGWETRGVVMERPLERRS